MPGSLLNPQCNISLCGSVLAVVAFSSHGEVGLMFFLYPIPMSALPQHLPAR